MACTHLVNCQGPLGAEIWACLEVLQSALQFSQLPIIVESDSALLIEALNSSNQDRSPFVHLITEIKSLASIDRECLFVKVGREQVRVSDSLANFARVQGRTMTWLRSRPADAVRLLDLACSVILPTE
uniref:Uncharacterized protein n=1 Tax=Avena sativa TaxID=4498 RepID=A0ACD5ZXV3_AVESA